MPNRQVCALSCHVSGSVMLCDVVSKEFKNKVTLNGAFLPVKLFVELFIFTLNGGID